MRDRKQIRGAIEGVTAETGGWDAPPTWSQIADVLAVLLDEARAGEAAEAMCDEEKRDESSIIAALRARADRLLDAGGGTGTGAEMEREINRLAREVICNVCDEARETPAPLPPGVLAVVEVSVLRRIDCVNYAIVPIVDLPADAPARVTVAVLTGPLAGIVEAHRAPTECEHANAVIQGGAVLWCIDCGAFQPWNNGPAGRWQSPRLAAEVKP